MNIYVIYRRLPGVVSDRAYNSAVVVAPDEATARRMHPSDGSLHDEPDENNPYDNGWDQSWQDGRVVTSKHPGRDWVPPSQVGVTLLGVASDKEKETAVVLASKGSNNG